MTQTPTDAPEVDREINYFVGDLRVDIGQQRVTRSGVEIALPNLSFQLLVALIRAAPNVLSHDALMEQVWPGLIVSPETLHKRANLLREALKGKAKLVTTCRFSIARAGWRGGNLTACLI